MTLQEQIAHARGVEAQARAACHALGYDPDEPMMSSGGISPGVGYIPAGLLTGGLPMATVPRWAIVAEQMPSDMGRLDGSA